MSNALRVTGRVEKPLELNYEQLVELATGQVPDVSRLDASRRGAAVRLDALLTLAESDGEARHLTIRSSEGFEARVPLDAVRQRAVLIYGLDGKPLPDDFGGPVRFFVPQAASCGLADVDACANVKQVTDLELS